MRETQRSDFHFKLIKPGLYRVVYTDPMRGWQYVGRTSDLGLIKSVILEDEPELKDLNQLKAICKTT